MDEAGARALLERVAGGEAPPARIDIGLARSKGRARLRWRLAAIAGGVPAAAVIAAAAVIVSGAFPLGAGGQRPAAARHGAGAPHRFSPVIPYARFGWLPPGNRITSAMTSAASEDLEVGPTGSPKSWDLMVYTAGGCNHTPRQLLGLLRGSHRPPIMKCTLNWDAFGGRPTLANPVFSVAPPVNGNRAFWATPVCNTNQCNLARAMLVWSYAPGGWARLSGPSRSDALKIAEHVTFGAGGPAIRFPVRITGANPSWRVSEVQSAQSGRGLVAGQWTLGTTMGSPSFGVSPQGPAKGPCQLLPASAERHRVINGFHVTTTVTAQGSQICSSHAGGLSVYIYTGASVTPDAIAIFAHHLRLLGASPASWTTRPLG